MSAFEPTAEQRAAIEHPAVDACVTAAAGSGKTAVLTRRFLHLVDAEGLPIRAVTALTFTEKAASQMRARIAGTLDEAGREEDRREVEFAPIATIHAFCARLLRLHAIEAGLDPAFEVLDADEARLLAEDAALLAEAGLREDRPDLAPALGAFSAGRDARLDLLEAARGLAIEPASIAWAAASDDDEEGAALEVLEAALAELDREAAAVDEHAAAGARAALEEIDDALAAGADGAWDLQAAGVGLRDVRPETGRGPRSFSAARKVAAEALDAVAGLRLDALARRDLARPFVAVLAAVDETYARLKAERGALDFADLELRTLALLEDLARRGRPLARPPAALLVDEYQDTNPLQARILARLREQGAIQLSVGDPKQSIYRFRGADVRVIGRERERVGSDHDLPLTGTFRSHPALVDTLNGLHDRLFADGAAGVEHVPMRAEAAFRPLDGPPVELAVVDVGAGTPVALGREAEARLIAGRIRALVEGEAARARVEHDKDGSQRPPRPLRFRDIAILLRVRTDLAIYEAALGDAGIPFRTHKGRGFFVAEEVRDVLNVLRVVHDPADLHALACALTGPACGASDADLLQLLPASTKADPLGAWRAFVARAEGDGVLAAPAATLARLRREAVAGSLAAVVEGVLDDLGLLDVALLQTDGERRGANLRKLLGLARRLEAEGRHGLGDLLRHVEMLRDREVAEAEAPRGREDEDVVRINTVHGAKGLEHPVVFLADVGRSPRSDVPPLLLDDEGGMTGRLVHPLEGTSAKPASFERLAAEDKARQDEESLRLLYVALTRAEERVIVSGVAKGRRKKDGGPAHFTGWGEALLDALGVRPESEARDVEVGAGRVRVQMVDPPPPAPPRPAPAVVVDEATRQAARARLEAAAAPVAPLADTPYVVTVSDLLHFARSPAEARARRLGGSAGAGAQPQVAAEPDDPASLAGAGAGPDAGRRADRRLLLGEEPAGPEARDAPAAARGRAVHALIERLAPAAAEPDEHLLEEVVADEIGPQATDADRAAVRSAVARFVASRTGRATLEALARADGPEVAREVDFHARVRFPEEREVGGFDGLLVRGSIDLWLGTPQGLLVVDHKTNAPSRHLPTPEAVGAHYAWQLRLYALATERLRGEDVAGARLLLLDAGWGPEAVEVDVDVGGDALRAARRLCEAYARAELERRWPARWEDLLGGA